MDGKTRIYADNASTTEIDSLAFEAMLPYLQDKYSNPSSLHSFGRAARKAVESARLEIAECIGATPQEIFFTSCGTESDNWAIKSMAKALSEKGKHLVASAIEHKAVLNCLSALEQDGFAETLVPVDSCGLVSKSNLSAAMISGTTLVSIMLANNEIGTVQDIPGLVEVARSRKVVFHTDAVQAIGHIPVNVAVLGVDLLSASAHKFNGPKGVGFLFKRNEVLLPSFMNGGYQEAGFRAGTENVAGIVGMACALKNHISSLAENINRLESMAFRFKSRISEKIPAAIFNGHPTQCLPGMVSVSLPGISGESLLHLLDLKGIYVSTGAACNSKDTVVSHVLRAINLSDALSTGTLRVSFSKDNNDEDAVTIADTIAGLYNKLA